MEDDKPGAAAARPAVPAAPASATTAALAGASTIASLPVAVMRAEVAAMMWPDLQAAVQDCKACTLCQNRTQAVLGTGHAAAHWLVVGEAPGEQEDLKGEPFVGPSGQLLDHILAALQLTRSADPAQPIPPTHRVYIANTVKCRPPGNRNPKPEELAACEPFLLRQIELLRPRIILALGAFAIKALLRSDEPVGKLRGRVHRYHGVPLVVSYHPAYLLRQPLEKAKAWDDWCLAADTAQLQALEGS